MTRYVLTVILALIIGFQAFAQGKVIPTNGTQTDFLKAYKLALSASESDFRTTQSEMDTELFPTYSEYTLYRPLSGANKGAFIFPQALPTEFSTVTTSNYASYAWQNNLHSAFQFKKSNKVAIFKSAVQYNAASINWEASYFKSMFDSYLLPDMYYIINEDSLTANGLAAGTKLLIIPAFTLAGADNYSLIDALVQKSPSLQQKITVFLAQGGTIYAEGNAAYFMQKLGFLQAGAVNYANGKDAVNNFIDVSAVKTENILAFAAETNGNKLYSSRIPAITDENISVILKESSKNIPVVFELQGSKANGGTILFNTGLPMAGGTLGLPTNSRQMQYVFEAVFSAFAMPIDATRAVYNSLNDQFTSVTRNTISYNRIDTFEVRITLRNLSNNTISGIALTETISDYFTFYKANEGITVEQNGNELKLTGISLTPSEEKVLSYFLITPTVDSKKHEAVDDYLVNGTDIRVSELNVSFNENGTEKKFDKKHNYANIMFSARIVADTDLNWKNFLGLDYQPFKIFMIMANKERTTASNTVYTQYVPKDVPFYRVDHGLNIPILKTPGGDYIDILRGSYDEKNPTYDMDSDGKPDAWLDTASIYPKGYVLTEDKVYWKNPWNHLRNPEAPIKYEDLDRDGIIPTDADNNGVFEIEDEDDKLNVYKITWNIGEVAGLMAYDPYCSFEMWVDPPDLVPLSYGVGYAHDSIAKPHNGMFYPFSPNIETADLNNKSWERWMKHNEDGSVKWSQLIWQTVNNYRGFAFVDTSTYDLLPTDTLVGTAPQPHEEFIAVLSLGGEEIDMKKVTPEKSDYSKITYESIFGEKLETPIRTTYTYYAPLPNPLQFQYFSNSYLIRDTTTKEILQFLPAKGTVELEFDLNASTEYTYYWIRNVGTDVEFNDPSLATDTVDELGDGVFGYFVYEIPKGLGGYKIDLPRKSDNSIDVANLVLVDGKPFAKWLSATDKIFDQIEVWETPFSYQIYMPQLLIPPALDDNNGDGIDDWIDDRGDRFRSETGYLHDAFMKGNGEEYKNHPSVPFVDDIYGSVDSGWFAGADKTYGDDFFEALGKTNFKIKAYYTGKGKEGPVDISKGGWLVTEEIFGGSPWVVFAHTLSGFAKGTDIRISSAPNPSIANFGIDTVYIKHTIFDANEPHYFDFNFDPYHVSFGYGEHTITTYVGGKDACSLIEPAIDMPALIDLSKQTKKVTFIPLAKDLAGFPKEEEGAFFQVRFEITVGGNENWKDLSIETNANIYADEVMNYVAYPRPLVPGDNIGTFEAGWRFNEPESEVLVKLGNTLPLIQPGRRVYITKLYKVKPDLAKGIYTLSYTISGKKVNYKGEELGDISYLVPDAQFAIIERDNAGFVKEYPKMVIGQTELENLEVFLAPNFTPTENVKWSAQDINHTDFTKLTNKFSSVFTTTPRIETIELSSLNLFPKPDTVTVYALQEGILNSFEAGENAGLSDSTAINYFEDNIKHTEKTGGTATEPLGPVIIIGKAILKINGTVINTLEDLLKINVKDSLVVTVVFNFTNNGNDISQNTVIESHVGDYFIPMAEYLPKGFTHGNKKIKAELGTFLPGETKSFELVFRADENAFNAVKLKTTSCDMQTILCFSDMQYDGTAKPERFYNKDIEPLKINVFELEATDMKANRIYALPGDKTDLTFKITNRGLYAENINLAVFAVTKSDSVLIAQEQIASMNTDETYEFKTTYTIPDNAGSVMLYGVADHTAKLAEISKKNNKISTKVNIEIPYKLDQVSEYPNPVSDRLNIQYNLSRDMREVFVKVFSIDRKELLHIPNGSNFEGAGQIEVNTRNLPAGIYMYRIFAIDDTGQLHEFERMFVKDKK